MQWLCRVAGSHRKAVARSKAVYIGPQKSIARGYFKNVSFSDKFMARVLPSISANMIFTDHSPRELTLALAAAPQQPCALSAISGSH
jgi:hypothetical protein